ncbi:MAG: glutaredoxin, partial [Candidatus Micrarchaeota archaeon]
MKKFLLFLLVFAGLANALTVEYFYGDGCPHCANVKPHWEALKQQYTDVEFKEYEVYSNSENAIKLTSYFNSFNVPSNEQGVPIVFVNGKHLTGDTPIIEKLEKTIQDALNSNETCGPTEVPVEESNFNLTLAAVVGAAIVDAINPCAFAVLILLLTTILASGDRKRTLYAGLAFTAAVYLSYFLMGLG